MKKLLLLFVIALALIACKKDPIISFPKNHIFPIVPGYIQWGMSPQYVYDIMMDEGCKEISIEYYRHYYRGYRRDVDYEFRFDTRTRELYDITVYYFKDTPEVRAKVESCLRLARLTYDDFYEDEYGRKMGVHSKKYSLDIRFANIYSDTPGVQWFCRIHTYNDDFNSTISGRGN